MAESENPGVPESNQPRAPGNHPDSAKLHHEIERATSGRADIQPHSETTKKNGAQHERKSFECAHLRQLRIQNGLLGLALGAAAIAAVIAAQQLGVSRDTAKKDLRAYVGVKVEEIVEQNDLIGIPFTFLIRINNAGQTPGYQALANDTS